MQKEPKNKESVFESLVFWVFLHDSVNQALGKILSLPRLPVTFSKIKCGRGSGKELISLQDSGTKSYEENPL